MGVYIFSWKKLREYLLADDADADSEKDFGTQAQLAERINKKRTFISKVENDGGNLTLKTLIDIVERGLGGKLNIEVKI